MFFVSTAMRILMLNHNVIWKSAFHRCFQLGKRLYRKGHEVTIITNSPTSRFRIEELDIEGVHIVESPDLLWGQLRTGWDIWNTIVRMRYLRMRSYDIIHAFDTRPTVIIPALYFQKRIGVPLIIDWGDWWGRGGAINLRKPWILNKLFEPVETHFEEYYKLKANVLTTVSAALRDRAIKLGISENSIEIIPNGSDTESIKPTTKVSARKLLGLSRTSYLLIFSSFVLYDLKFVLESFKKVLARIPETQLILTGEISPITSQIVGDFVRSGKVIQTGLLPRKKLAMYLSASDICLLPLSDTLTNRARYPGKLGDYVAASRPVVANPIGDIARHFQENRIGLLAKPNTEDFAEKIVHLLGDKTLRSELGNNARIFAEEKHSWEIYAQKLETIYLKALTLSAASSTRG